MQKEEVIGGISAIGSTIVAILGYLWNIGFVQLVFSFLAGSFSTYLIQRRLQVESEKRRISREHRVLMRDKIYGPLFEAMSQSLEKTQEIESPDRGTINDNPLLNIQEVKEHYLFRLSEEELRNTVSKIHKDLIRYCDVLGKAERAVYDISLSKLREAYPEAKQVEPRNTFFRLMDHKMTIQTVGLIEAILKRVNPLKMFRETMSNLESPTIEIALQDYKVENLETFEKVFMKIEDLAWRENRLLEHEEQRKKIIKNLRMIIPKLEKRIVV